MFGDNITHRNQHASSFLYLILQSGYTIVFNNVVAYILSIWIPLFQPSRTLNTSSFDMLINIYNNKLVAS